jgi:hypothetical protein
MEVERYYLNHGISIDTIPKKCQLVAKKLQNDYTWFNGENVNVPTFTASSYENYKIFYECLSKIIDHDYSHVTQYKFRMYQGFLKKVVGTFFLKEPENWIWTWGVLVNQQMEKGYGSQSLLKYVWEKDHPLFSKIMNNRLLQYLDHSRVTWQDVLSTFKKYFDN